MFSAGLIKTCCPRRFGDDRWSYLGDDLKEAFNVTGLAHILSISGTHFGLFSVMMFAIFVFLVKRLPYGILQRLSIYLTPSQAAAVLTMPVMAMYLGLSGSGPPAVRSFVIPHEGDLGQRPDRLSWGNRDESKAEAARKRRRHRGRRLRNHRSPSIQGILYRDGNEYEEENNSSLVLSVKGRNEKFLFAGDTGEEPSGTSLTWRSGFTQT